MSWFSRLRNWQTDQANGIGIRADYHDEEDNNFALGINESINYEGLNTPIANLPMGGFKFTGLANGTAASDSATFGQIQTSIARYGVDAPGTDAYAITLTPALTAYVAGQSFDFYAATTNTGASTLNINALGAKTIKKDVNTDLADNDIKVGQINRVVYDGTNFQLVSPTYGQLNQSCAAIYAADGGGSDAYVITLPTVPIAYTNGMLIDFKANTANTGAATINVNSLGVKSIVKDVSLTLNDNDIKAGQVVQIVYDGTNFQMSSPQSYLVSQSGSQTYAADAQANDTYVITLSPALTAYVAGFPVRFKANTANTGAATLNVNSLGAIAIKKFGTTNDVATGDILAGQIVNVVYDGTNFQMLSCVEDIVNLTTDSSPDLTSDYCKTWDASASTYKKVLLNNFGALACSQADQETATSNTVYVTPGRQQYHPSAAKAWGVCDLTGALGMSYNVSSVTDTSTSVKVFNYTVSFSAATYHAIFSQYNSAGSAYNPNLYVQSRTSGTTTCFNDSEGSSNTNFGLTAWGDQ